MDDDMTALTTDDDSTAITDVDALEEHSPNIKAKGKFSFFDYMGSNTSLKYMSNTIDESTAVDDPSFARKRMKHGKNTVKGKPDGVNKKLIVTIVLGITVLLAVTAVLILIRFTPEERLKKLLSLGEKYLSELDYENAIMAYEAALKIDPRNEPAYIGLTKSYIGLEDYDKALETVEKAIVMVDSTDELINLRRRIFIMMNGKEGLYLDNGRFVPVGSSILITDLEKAFFYFDSMSYVRMTEKMSDHVYTKEEKTVNGTNWNWILQFQPDELILLDDTHFAQNDFDRLNRTDCWMYIFVYKEAGNYEMFEDYNYHLFESEISEMPGEVIEEEGEDFTEEDQEDNIEDMQSAEETEDESGAEDDTNENPGGCIILTDGTVVSPGGDITLSDLKSAKYIIEEGGTWWYTAIASVGPYYVDEDPEPNWAYEGQFAPGEEMLLEGVAEWIADDPDYDYLTVETTMDIENGPIHEYNFHIIR
ncbi:MAG: tetratricopeptide repeat protein [Lachnospiraceae bacterium]|nr:tetratricopeptide repeat protein [Lachnospiraceae bacterium]